MNVFAYNRIYTLKTKKKYFISANKLFRSLSCSRKILRTNSIYFFRVGNVFEGTCTNPSKYLYKNVQKCYFDSILLFDLFSPKKYV